jgi:phosphoribosylformylglycinamidine synthase
LRYLEFYSLDVSAVFSDHEKLSELLNCQESSDLPNFFVGPRSGTISPWSSKTFDIINNVGIQGIHSIEKYFGYFINGNTDNNNLNLLCLFDRMTQQVFMNAEDLIPPDSFAERKPLLCIEISNSA